MDNNQPIPMTTQLPPEPTAPATSGLKGPVELLTDAWNLFRAHWKVLSIVAIIPSLVQFIAGLFFHGANQFFVAIGVILLICSVILSVAMVPAIIDTVHQLSGDPQAIISPKNQYRTGLKRFWSLILLLVIVGLSTVGGAFLLVIPGIIMAVYTYTYTFAFVLDGKKGFAAPLESYTLIHGRFWPVFGRMLFIGIVIAVASVLIALIGKTLMILGIAKVLSAAILTPIAVAYSYRLYLSLKSVRVETHTVAPFKKWLIAFMCVGAIGFIVLGVTGVVAASRAVEQFRSLDRNLSPST